MATSPAQDRNDASGDAPADLGGYFDALRRRVDPFIAQQFGWKGTLRLHRDALGWDILRAPVNVLLSPVFVLSRLAGFLCNRTGLRRFGSWLVARRILLPTSVSRRVRTRIAGDLLALPLPEGGAVLDSRALAQAVLAAPQLRAALGEQAGRAQGVVTALSDYAGTRSAVAEMTSVLFTILIGATVFQALTPGMISMAPGVADAVARAAAIADFPLGQTLGGLWYGVFSPGASPALIAATVVALVMAGSVVAAFAGVIADPVQKALGIHRRRLHRLIDTLEAELTGDADKPFAAREHYFARALDLWDVVASLLRALRN